MGRASRRDSLRALNAASDLGITFFDTARSYGYGESETVLGEFLRGRRDQVVVSTKFGILPVGQHGWKKAARGFARKLFRFVPAARRAARTQIAAQFSHNQFSTEILRRSLNESLRQLRTDYVDFLFLHSPPASVLEQDELFGELERIVAAGKVRFAGISAGPELAVSQSVHDRRVLKASQIPVNLFNLHRTSGYKTHAEQRVLVANLPFGGVDGVAASRDRIRRVAGLRGVPAGLARKLAEQDDGLMADVVLNVILRHTGIHTVVPSMIRMQHLRANVDAIVNSRFSNDEITCLREEFARLNTQPEVAAPQVGQ